MATPINSLFIDPETLFVGIGTQKPQAKLTVAGHICPATTLTYDLGTSNLRFRDLYLSGTTINLGGTAISRDATTGGLKVTDPASGNAPLDMTVRNLTASNLQVLGDYVTLNTITSNTEQIVITNAGTGPALQVIQTGTQPIADFYDDAGVLAMRVADGGNVGIGTIQPFAKLDINGTTLFSNPCWILYHNTGGNAVYDTSAKHWGSSISNSISFNTVTTYNSANTNAWNVSTGLFTFPMNGLYNITINMFINGSTSGRTGVISFTSTILPTSQYIPFEPNALGANYFKSYNIMKLCNANDTFKVHSEGGSITLFLALVHTNFIINKIG